MTRPRANAAVLLGNVLEATVASLHQGLAAAGFGDIRPVDAAVFRNVGDGRQVAEMARRAHVTKQAMAELVQYLEKRGYLERVPDPDDRRGRIVRLSAKGREANDAAQEAFWAYEKSWVEHIGEEGVRQFRDLLERLERGLEPDWSRGLVRSHFRSRETAQGPAL